MIKDVCLKIAFGGRRVRYCDCYSILNHRKKCLLNDEKSEMEIVAEVLFRVTSAEICGTMETCLNLFRSDVRGAC